MAVTQTLWSQGRRQSRVPEESGVVVTERFTHTFVIADDPQAGQIIEMGALPAGCVVTDMIVISDDLDTGTPAILFDVGLVDGTFGDIDEGDARSCGDEFFDGSDLAQAGGVARMTLATGFEVAADYVNDRGIGVVIDTAAATFAAGTIQLNVSYIAAQ